jgi:hypothetical protein
MLREVVNPCVILMPVGIKKMESESLDMLLGTSSEEDLQS